jgi:hypothetical protein
MPEAAIDREFQHRLDKGAVQERKMVFDPFDVGFRNDFRHPPSICAEEEKQEQALAGIMAPQGGEFFLYTLPGDSF